MKTVLNERELEMINGGRKFEDYEAQEDIKLWPYGRNPLSVYIPVSAKLREE